MAFVSHLHRHTTPPQSLRSPPPNAPGHFAGNTLGERHVGVEGLLLVLMICSSTVAWMLECSFLDLYTFWPGTRTPLGARIAASCRWWYWLSQCLAARRQDLVESGKGPAIFSFAVSFILLRHMHCPSGTLFSCNVSQPGRPQRSQVQGCCPLLPLVVFASSYYLDRSRQRPRQIAEPK